MIFFCPLHFVRFYAIIAIKVAGKLFLYLMAWQQSDDGKALIDSNGADSATDGDLDIAYALLLADRSGEAAAKSIIGRRQSL